MDAMIDGPDRSSAAGRVDHACLLFLYNGGERASETAGLQVEDLHIPKRSGENAHAMILGKGGKIRITRRSGPGPPLPSPASPWTGRPAAQASSGAGAAGPTPDTASSSSWSGQLAGVPELDGRKITPHVLRHSCAYHLLHAGIDINTIRAWLGHASLATTNIYAEVDLRAKEAAMKTTFPDDAGDEPRWRAKPGLLEQLKAI